MCYTPLMAINRRGKATSEGVGESWPEEEAKGKKRREEKSGPCVRKEAPESDSKAKKGKGKNRGGEKGTRECRGFVFPFFVLWYSVFFLYVSLWVLKVVTSFVTF